MTRIYGDTQLETRRGSFWLLRGGVAAQFTFFYAFSARPPFNIVCVTPAFDFGLSDDMEYPMHMELHGNHLYVSLGIDNCWSALVRVPLAGVLQFCNSLGSKVSPSSHFVQAHHHGKPYLKSKGFDVVWTGDRIDGKRQPVSLRSCPGNSCADMLLPCKGAFCLSRRARQLEKLPASKWPVLRKSGWRACVAARNRSRACESLKGP